MHEDDVAEVQAQPEPTTVEAFTERGNARLRNGNLDTAIEDFEVAIRLDPTHTQALLGRGKAWQRKGEHVKAIRDFDEVNRLEPENAEALGHRGIARHFQREFAKAVKDYDRAIHLGPNQAWLYSGRGAALHAEGDLDAAISHSPAPPDGRWRTGKTSTPTKSACSGKPPPSDTGDRLASVLHPVEPSEVSCPLPRPFGS